MKYLFLSTRFMNTWSNIASIHNLTFFCRISLSREDKRRRRRPKRFCPPSSDPLAAEKIQSKRNGRRRMVQDNERPISTSYFSESQQVLLLHLAQKNRMSVFLKVSSHYLLSAICCRVWSEVLFSFFFLHLSLDQWKLWSWSRIDDTWVEFRVCPNANFKNVYHSRKKTWFFGENFLSNKYSFSFFGWRKKQTVVKMCSG